jgi:Cu/Ag efflux pump CusA
MKSTRMIELRTTMPAPAMKPIMEVAVKKAPIAQCAGRMPTSVSGIGAMITSGTVNDSNQKTTSPQIRMSTIANAKPMSRNTSQSVIDAGAVRFRPMLLTAAAVVCGAGVILFDPIFQGLAIALMAGEVASTLLSRIAVPVLYFMLESRRGRAGGE